jgi:hypothetical protein
MTHCDGTCSLYIVLLSSMDSKLTVLIYTGVRNPEQSSFSIVGVACYCFT